MANQIKGLNSEEVSYRIENGLINIDTEDSGKSIKSIIKTNTFTIFNGINLILAILVIIAGSPKNILFSGVILTNTLTGIFQEIKAKKTLEKLSLLNKHFVKVIRNGSEESISPNDIVKDDIIILEPGVQVPTDGTLILDNNIEIDTSVLTGESLPIIAKKEDFIYSGTIVVGGSSYLRAEKIGNERYMSRLALEAKEFKIVNSEIKESIDRIMSFLIKIIVPLGLVLMISQMFFADKPWRDALLSTVAGIISMIPEGLVLLTTLSFLMGVIRLAKWNTLVQELPATEVLARVDTLCLDKTGTITKGSLKLKRIIPISEDINLKNFINLNHSCFKSSSSNIDEQIKFALYIVSKGFDVANQTQQAIIEYCKDFKEYEIENINFKNKIPFDSIKRWSALETEDGNVIFTGAPEALLKHNISESIKSTCDKLTKQGNRVLMIGTSKSTNIDKENINPLGLLIFEEEIRESAKSTIKYFENQGVDIKIISGDNPLTVSAIAKKIEMKRSDLYIDAKDLPDDIEKLKDSLSRYSIFGRVSPQQKKLIVETLQDMGRTVAMTGDGINDILALKKADCSIALANGTSATKAISQLVLLDEDFSNLTHIVDEGRRIINNLERTSGLYLSKTIYSILLSIFFAFTGFPYPFIPIQLTLIGGLSIGIPSFFLSFESNTEKVHKNFLKRVLGSTIPKGITAATFSISCFLIGYLSSIDIETVRTFTTLVLGSIGLIILYIISEPMNKNRFILFFTMTVLFILAFIVPLSRKIFSFHKLDYLSFITAFILIVISYPVIKILEKLVRNKISKTVP